MSDKIFGVSAAGTPTDYVDNESIANGSGQTAMRQRVRLGGALGSLLAQVLGYGSLRVTQDNPSEFYDPFDTTIDTVYAWNAPAVGGSGSSSQATGGLTLSTGTSASSYATLGSQPTFVGRVPGFEQIGWANMLPASIPSGTYAFWGVGTVPATPTTTAPLTDAVGWEIDTSGKLWAVVYQAGTRTAIANVTGTGDGSLSSSGSSVQPTDGKYHRYSLIMRTDRTYWYVDSQDAHVAVSDFQFPSVQRLPLRMLVISGASVPPAAMTLTSTGVGAGDSGANSTMLSDGANPWRKASVLTSGALGVGEKRETASASPVIPAPSATGTITVYSGQGASNYLGLSDSAFTGGAPAAGSTAYLIPGSDHSSFSVQVTGTWTGTLQTEVTLDGQTWIPVNTRASGTGTLKNNFTTNGLYRGVLGGCYALRVRAITTISGSASIFMAVGSHAAVFQNSDVLSLSEAQYFASSSGGNSAWGVSSQEISLAAAGTEYPLMFLWNNDPSGGRVIYLSKVTKGASASARFRRYRTGPGGTNMTYSSGGSALTINNRANQNATATCALAYGGTGITVTNKPAYAEKTVYIGSQGGQLETDENGGILIPPQVGILWTAVCESADEVASIEVAYWDGTSLT